MNYKSGIKTSILYICLLLLMTFAYYYIRKWEYDEVKLLNKLKHSISNPYNLSKLEELLLFEKIKKESIEMVRHGIYEGMEDEMNSIFYPEHDGDVKLKYDFKSAVEDFILQDVSKAIRQTMEEEIKKIVNDVISENILPSQSKQTYKTNLCSVDKKLPSNQKLLVYAIFGTRKLYYEGIPSILNEILASNLYHTWRIRIYHDALITPEVMSLYENNIDFCDARKLPIYGDVSGILGKFWRTVPLADESVDIVCSRDLDSALLTREEDAVKEFLNSDKMIHSMRDHPMHDAGMLAGMWCMKNIVNRSMARGFFETLLKEAKTYTLKSDQPLLNKVIFDSLTDQKKLVMQHDAYLCKKYEGTLPFPTKRKDDMEFVGCPNHICNWKDFKKCPAECRPKAHQDWEYC